MKADSMTTDIEVAQPQAVSRPANVLDLIQAAVNNPDIKPEIIREFLAIQREVEDRAAEKEFIAAFMAMQDELPAVVKDGKIKLIKEGRDLGSIPFATFENVMLIVKPILRKFRFAESFTSKETANGVLITLTLRHAAGHSKDSEIRLPPDPGPGRNNLQAVGSSFKYAKRYLVLGMLSIVTINEGDSDNDGAGAGDIPITAKQADQIIGLLIDAGISEREFLKMASIPDIASLQSKRFDGAVTSLKAKIKARSK